MNEEKLELNDIMGELSDIAFGMDGLRDVLMVLEEAYDMRHDHSSRKMVHIIGMVLDSLSENLSDRIDELDHFIIDSKAI